MFKVLSAVATLSLLASFILAAADPAPGTASGEMQVVTAGLAALSAVMVCLNTYLNGRQARQQRKWAEEDRRRMNQIHREVRDNTAMTRIGTEVVAEVGKHIGKENGLKERIEAKLARFDELTAEPNDTGGLRTPGAGAPPPGTVPPDSGPVPRRDR